MSNQKMAALLLRYNAANKKVIAQELIKYFPLIFMLYPMLTRGAWLQMLVLATVVMGGALMTVVIIKPPKFFYIAPLTLEERRRYVAVGYGVRIFIAELLVIVETLVLYVLQKVSLPYVLLTDTLALIVLIAMNDSAIVQVEQVPQQKQTEFQTMFYSFGERIILAIIYVIAAVFCMLLPVRQNIFDTELILLLLIGVLVIAAGGYLIHFHKTRFWDLICIAADYEEQVRVKKKLSMM